MHSDSFRLARYIITLAVVLLTLLTGCGGLQAQQQIGEDVLTPVTRTPTPTLLPVTVTPTVISLVEPPEGSQLQARSGRVERGKAYPFRLQTHCGVDYAVDFDGSFWLVAPEMSSPPVVGNPYQEGMMTLIDDTTAQFDFQSGTIMFARYKKTKIVSGCD